MSEGKRRVFSREFKLSAVERMLAGESAAAVSREFQVPAGHLYRWCKQFRRGGAEGAEGAQPGGAAASLRPGEDEGGHPAGVAAAVTGAENYSSPGRGGRSAA